MMPGDTDPVVAGYYHATAVPLRAPVLLRHGTVLLDNAGGWRDTNHDNAEEAS